MTTINSYLLPPPEYGPGWHTEHEREFRFPALQRLVDTMLLWRQRAIERARLATLDERLLKDIGINRLDVLREVRKPVWQD